MTAKTIMIVDDDHHLVLGLAARLKFYGYRVVAATDAVTAISTARKENPDLIVLDLGLPGGDGFLVMERMKGVAELDSIPVIVLSAREPTGNKQRALDANAVAFLQKPPDNRQFLSAVRYALGEGNSLSTFLAT